MKMSKDGLILGEDAAGVNQILPHKHEFAWDLFLKGVANNWSPAEVNMSIDIDQWKSGELSEDEKLASGVTPVAPFKYNSILSEAA